MPVIGNIKDSKTQFYSCYWNLDFISIDIRGRKLAMFTVSLHSGFLWAKATIYGRTNLA